MTKKTTLFLITFITLLPALSGFSLNYVLTTDSGSTNLYWDITEKNNTYVMESLDPMGTRTFISDRNGSIRNFTYHDLDNNTYFKGSRENRSIEVSRLDKTDREDNSFRSNTDYWYQPLGFCFFDFARSDDKKRDFFMVNPDTLEPVKLTVKKIGMETISLRGEERRAIKAELRLSGIMAAFWHGTYWLDPDNGVLLRYIGTFGPGTERTVMELTEVSGEVFF